jgi:hypothetical protein
MTDDIACSLGAAELHERLTRISAVRESLLAAEVGERRAVLRFRADARDQLAGIVAAEAECCPFLSMTLDEDGDTARLTIEAPADAEPVLRDLVAAFS